MIELDVEAKSTKPKAVDSVKTRYLVLGDFGGLTTEPITLDRDNLDMVLSRLNVTLSGLRIREIEDFHPDRLYQRIEGFEEAAAEADEPARPHATPKADIGEILKPGSLLEQIVEGGDPFQQYLKALARAHAAPAKRDTTARDKELGERMRAVLHHPRFQQVEAAWRGLDLVTRHMDDELCSIHIAQMSRQELERDVLETENLRSTRTFQLLTGRPWKAVFGLYSFGAAARDAELLGRIGLIASHAKTMFLAEGSVDMGEYWSQLRAIPEARHIGLALPRLLLRLPYGSRTSKVESFPFEEMPERPVHSDYLWGNPALGLLTIAARGPAEEDLELNDLPLHTFQENGEWKATPCAEVLMTDSHVDALIGLGLIPMVSFRDSDRVRIAGIRAITGASLPLI